MSRIRTPLIVGLCVIFLGTFVITFFDLYSFFPHLDKILHVSGGFLTAWFFARYWQDKFGTFSSLDRFLMLLAITALVGVLWELAEFSTSIPPLAHHKLLRHYLYIGSLIDTLDDLVADIFGAALCALLLRKNKRD